MAVSTHWKGRHLSRGDVLDVDDAVAARWSRFGIAEVRGKTAPLKADGPRLDPDFPGFDALSAVGYTHVNQLKGLDEDAFLLVKGIGKATARRIVEALETRED